ncbi:MAG: ABC transporter ATP-binding protein, partial [bacterium]|nr:ABC transporter ATP-binding protein [bacterium]
MTTRTLSFHDVGVRFGERQVLDGVSFEVNPGEVVGLVGHNGSGKTTLLRVATRVLQADAGEVRLGGQAIGHFSRAELARALATVPQDTQLPYPFSALEVVLMGRAPHQPLFGLDRPEDLACAERAMEQLDIAELAPRSIQKLSGGERQLVMFARALAQEPEILLLDEPTAFLDLRHRIDLLGAVRARVDRGGAALVVSHDLGLVARVCDRLVLLSHGQVVAAGRPADVLEPALLERAFGIEADIVSAPDGS